VGATCLAASTARDQTMSGSMHDEGGTYELLKDVYEDDHSGDEKPLYHEDFRLSQECDEVYEFSDDGRHGGRAMLSCGERKIGIIEERRKTRSCSYDARQKLGGQNQKQTD
jgi:hypothetical protein